MRIVNVFYNSNTLSLCMQTKVVKELAAAQRAAVRTLQSLGGQVGVADILPELSLLVLQLSLLWSQLGGGTGSGESDISASLHQLMVGDVQ